MRKALSTLLVVAAAACGGDSGTNTPPPGAVAVASVTVTLAASTIAADGTTQATATLRDAGGAVLTGRAVQWSSGSTAIATVSGNGVVTAVAPGTTAISAISEGVTGSTQVTVTAAPVASVTVAAPQVQLTTGLTTQASATLRDAGGAVLTGRTITWLSNTPGVATVDGNGLVVAVGAGSATITATSEGRSGAILVTVAPPAVASVTVAPGTVSMVPGQSTPLSAVVRDASQGVLQDRPVTWNSSNQAVATVSGAGVLTAVSAGNTTITATSAGISGTALVSVSVTPVASVTLNSAPLTMQAGDVRVLIATPRDASSNPLSGRTVSWTSTNLSIVDGYVFADTAVITGLTVGSATVTATVEGRSVSILVNVIAPQGANLCSQIAGASIFASDGQYLGRLTNRFDPQSAFNEFGLYGSKYQANSTNNRYGQYGSPYGSKSAWNPYASSPPILYKNNVALAYYTVNTFKTPYVSPAYAAQCNFP